MEKKVIKKLSELFKNRYENCIDIENFRFVNLIDFISIRTAKTNDEIAFLYRIKGSKLYESKLKWFEFFSSQQKTNILKKILAIDFDKFVKNSIKDQTKRETERANIIYEKLMEEAN